MRLGRFTFTDATPGAATGAVLKTVDLAGDQLSVAFHLAGTSTELDPAVLHQWSNLPSAAALDEPTVPFEAPTDRSDLDGFYRVTDARVAGYDVNGSSAEATVTATMVRELSAAASLGEGATLGVERTNVQSAGSGGIGNGYWYGIPGTTADLTEFRTTMGTGATDHTRDNEDGGVDAMFWASGSASGERTVVYGVTPSNWYKAAARILVDAPDSTSQVPLVGRQPHLGTDGEVGWLLSNGSIRMRPVGADGQVETSRYIDGVGWSTWKAWEFQTATGTVLDRIASWSVLYNGPDWAGVRLTMSTVANPETSFTVDVTVKRGSLFFEGAFLAPEQGATTIGKIKRASAEAGTMQTFTAVNFAMRATSFDGDDLKYVLGSVRAIGGDTIIGGISRLAAGDELPFFLGYEENGAHVRDQAEYLFRQYVHVLAQRLAVVGR